MTYYVYSNTGRVATFLGEVTAHQYGMARVLAERLAGSKNVILLKAKRRQERLNGLAR